MFLSPKSRSVFLIPVRLDLTFNNLFGTQAEVAAVIKSEGIAQKDKTGKRHSHHRNSSRDWTPL